MTGRDKTRMSRDITKEGPEKWTVTRSEMDEAALRLKGSAVRVGAEKHEFMEVLAMVGYFDQEFLDG
jgi:hypothetical protein